MIQLFLDLMESKDNSYLQLPTVRSIYSFLCPLLWEEVLSQDVGSVVLLLSFQACPDTLLCLVPKESIILLSQMAAITAGLPTVVVDIRKASALGSVGGGHKYCKFSFFCYICLYIYKYNVHIYKYKYIINICVNICVIYIGLVYFSYIYI